jgi:hypothetical protein
MKPGWIITKGPQLNKNLKNVYRRVVYLAKLHTHHVLYNLIGRTIRCSLHNTTHYFTSYPHFKYSPSVKRLSFSTQIFITYTFSTIVFER